MPWRSGLGLRLRSRLLRRLGLALRLLGLLPLLRLRRSRLGLLGLGRLGLRTRFRAIRLGGLAGLRRLGRALGLIRPRRLRGLFGLRQLGLIAALARRPALPCSARPGAGPDPDSSPCRRRALFTASRLGGLAGLILPLARPLPAHPDACRCGHEPAGGSPGRPVHRADRHDRDRVRLRVPRQPAGWQGRLVGSLRSIGLLGPLVVVDRSTLAFELRLLRRRSAARRQLRQRLLGVLSLIVGLVRLRLVIRAGVTTGCDLGAGRLGFIRLRPEAEVMPAARLASLDRVSSRRSSRRPSARWASRRSFALASSRLSSRRSSARPPRDVVRPAS